MDNSNIKARTPKVSVCVVTYNHEKYIEQCLQSLVDQVTDFDFEIIVGEDCSTDGTRAIVESFAKKYPDKVRPILHPRNIGAVANYITVHNAAHGEYIAHMDGDDYALPQKLQIQSTYLDENPKCSVVWHRMKILDQKSGNTFSDLINNKKLLKKKYKQSDLLSIGSISCHSSKFFRKSSNPASYPEGDFLDFLVNVENLSSGYGAYIDEFLGVYRSGVGVMQSPKIKELFIENLEYICKKYPKKKGYAAALFLKLLVIEIKRNGEFKNRLMINLAKNFRPCTIPSFISNLGNLKYFKSPI